MCFGSQPKAPDPYGTAMMQNQVNSAAIKDTAKYNQVNQTTPFGSSTWSGSYDDPTDPRSQNTTLSPELMKLLQGQEGIAQTLTDAAGSRLQGLGDMSQYKDPTTDMSLDNGANWKLATGFADPTTNTVDHVQGPHIQDSFADVGGPQRGLNNQDFGQQIADAQNAAYGTQSRFVDQGFDRQQHNLESQLAAKGIPEGSQAWNDAETQLQNQRQEASQSAQNAAVTAGGSMQNQLFGQQLQSAGFGNEAQQQAFTQAMQRGDFGNQAQMLSFGAGMQNANLANTVNDQQFGQNLAKAQFGNQAMGQQFQQGMQLQNYNQGEQQRQIGNQIQGRNQNFNEAAAFLNGSPISPNNPTFQPTTQYTPAQAAPNAVGTANNNYTTAQQARAAVMGSIFGAAGNIGSNIPWTCWVAREVYGVNNPRWFVFRDWMLNRAPKDLLAFYLEHGPRIADFIKGKPSVKLRLFEQMEAVLG